MCILAPPPSFLDPRGTSLLPLMWVRCRYFVFSEIAQWFEDPEYLLRRYWVPRCQARSAHTYSWVLYVCVWQTMWKTLTQRKEAFIQSSMQQCCCWLQMVRASSSSLVCEVASRYPACLLRIANQLELTDCGKDSEKMMCDTTTDEDPSIDYDDTLTCLLVACWPCTTRFSMTYI